jgi:2-dehydro-3-deoxygluconokinase
LNLELRDRSDCAYDVVALGEVMLRLDPGVDRIRTAQQFRVWEGGGEYNVARALTSCFGLRSAFVTSLVDNEIGRLIEGMIRRSGVDLTFLTWLPFDGVGREARNALNFVERGFGVRGALGVSDRGHSATSFLRPEDTDWEDLFGHLGVRCLHTSGIFTALSESAADTAELAMRTARAHGTLVSYDLNYRPSLWAGSGGAAAAAAVNRRLLPLVDVMIGVETPGSPTKLRLADTAVVRDRIAESTQKYPNLTVVASTLREVHSATTNDWSALAWALGRGYAEPVPRYGLEILDRVGGGDGFAAGFLYGLLEGDDLQQAVDYGAAHGALVMTTPGDTSNARLDEVRALAETLQPDIQR